MYEHELELINSGQRLTWDQILAKRSKDSREGKNFKDANIITFDEQSYIDNWVNYYRNLAPSKEDRDKMPNNTLKKIIHIGVYKVKSTFYLLQEEDMILLNL